MNEQEQAIVTLIREAVQAAFRRWKLIAGIYSGLVLAAVAAIFIIPPTYRASGKILFSTDRAEISTTADRGTEIVRTVQVSDGEMESQLQILRSTELIEGVLASMEPPKLVGEAEAESGGGGLGALLRAPLGFARTAYKRLHNLEQLEPDSPRYWETRAVLESLDTYNVRPSSIVDVAFWSSDPAWAQSFVNRLMNAYVEQHARMQQVSEAQQFFNQQSELLREKLTESEADLKTARERAGSLAGQEKELHRRLNEFNAELSRARISRVEQEQRVAYLEQRLGGAKGGQLASPELLQLEAERASLIGKYRADSQRIRSIDEEIERLRTAVSGYAAVAGSDATAATDLIGARAELEALKGRERALGTVAEEYRQQVEFLEGQGLDLSRIERRVKLDEETYLSYVRSAEESRLSNALEQSKLLRLRIIEPATLPLQAVAPRRSAILLFSLVGGLLLSLGIGLLRDHLDTTLKSAADVRRYAGLEALVVLPDRS